MLIEVKEDIIADAINAKPVGANDAITLLSELAIAARKGKHIVYVPCISVDSELQNNLQKVLSKSDYHFLKASQRNRSDFQCIINALDTKVICTYSRNIQSDSKWQRIIHYNPKDYSSFEIFEETHLLCENLDDVNYFHYLSKYYCRLHRIQNSKICFLGLMGGGNTTAKVLEQECKSIQHLCLVITDSDYQYPVDSSNALSELGDTAQKVNDIVIKYKNQFCQFYHMRCVSEVENLIPTKILSTVKPVNPSQKSILDSDFSFFDIKKGLTFLQLRNTNVYSHWKKLNCIELTSFDQFSKSHTDEKDFKEKGVLISGWGSTILSDVLTEDKCKSLLKEVSQSDLTVPQQKEWENIGKLIYNWTCVLPIRRT